MKIFCAGEGKLPSFFRLTRSIFPSPTNATRKHLFFFGDVSPPSIFWIKRARGGDNIFVVRNINLSQDKDFVPAHIEEGRPQLALFVSSNKEQFLFLF